MKKFYIVNDYKDLFSGKVIPHKVLDYLPSGGPMFQPMPITKHTGLTISPASPIYPGVYGQFSPISPFSPASPFNSFSAYDPFNNVSMSRSIMPLGPGGFGGIYGPPIIKLSPLMGQNIPGRIQIISDDDVTFTLNVPLPYIRAVVNYIYMNAQVALDPTKPKMRFRIIIPPTIDSTISTTYEKMYDIVRFITSNYSNIMYSGPDGRSGNMLALLTILYEMVRKHHPSVTPPSATPPPSAGISHADYEIKINSGTSFGVLTFKNAPPPQMGGPEKLIHEISEAGVIPYYKDGAGNCEFLLGFDSGAGANRWFGGGKESGDLNSRETAYRHVIEKSCKLSDKNDCYLPLALSIYPAMVNSNGLCVPISNGTTWANLYFIKIDKPTWVAKYGAPYVTISTGTLKNNAINKMEWFTEAQIRAQIPPLAGTIPMQERLLTIFRDNLTIKNNL